MTHKRRVGIELIELFITCYMQTIFGQKNVFIDFFVGSYVHTYILYLDNVHSAIFVAHIHYIQPTRLEMFQNMYSVSPCQELMEQK